LTAAAARGYVPGRSEFLVPRALPIALLLACTLPAVPAAAAKRTRCPDGRWVVVGQRLIQGDPNGANADTITLQGRRLSLDSGCSARRARVKAARAGTRVQARWPRCGALRKVALRALIDVTCQRMSGTIR
jgi:hypothetical protein